VIFIAVQTFNMALYGFPTTFLFTDQQGQMSGETSGVYKKGKIFDFG
jgi:hypothetical protein